MNSFATSLKKLEKNTKYQRKKERKEALVCKTT
jgi:hypothetical protein